MTFINFSGLCVTLKKYLLRWNIFCEITDASKNLSNEVIDKQTFLKTIYEPNNPSLEMNRQKMSTFKKSFDSGDNHEVNENKHIAK